MEAPVTSLAVLRVEQAGLVAGTLAVRVGIVAAPGAEIAALAEGTVAVADIALAEGIAAVADIALAEGIVAAAGTAVRVVGTAAVAGIAPAV